MENKRVKKTIATIPRLPVELLDEICSWAQQPPNAASLSALSLVSREFCSVVQPRLLSHLNIGGFSTQLRRRPAQLKSLSEGKCAASRFAKSLTFNFTLSFAREDPGKVFSPIEIVMHKHLKAAIQSCKRVERIVSIVGDHDPKWVHDQIFESSQILPLKELVVRVINCGTPSFRIGSLFNLRKICIEHQSSLPQKFIDQLAILISQCPKLTHLEVSCRHTSIESLFRVINADNTNPPLSIEHLSLKGVEVTASGLELALRHLKALKYLGLLENTSGSRGGGLYDNTDIWAILCREKIILSTIFTDWLEPKGFGSYLQAFCGLENLHVRPIPHTHIPSLFQFVLPHSISLMELNIDTTHSFLDDWEWPFEEASIRDPLSSFPNLQIFGVTFRPQFSYGQESRAPESVITLLEFSLKNFPRLQRIVIHVHMIVPSTSTRPHFQYNFPLEWPQLLYCDVHEAILAHPVEYHGIESMPVIECQGIVYYASRNLATGDRSYMPLHPVTFEGLGNQAGANCKRWKYLT